MSDQTQELGLGCLGREDEAQSRERIQLRDGQPECCEGAYDGRSERDVMDDVGPQLAVKATDCYRRGYHLQRIDRATPPGDWVQDKAFIFDLMGAFDDTCRNMDFISGAPSGASHREPM